VEDEHQLYIWRNEPSTRAVSLTTHEITLAEHRAWFAQKLEDPSSAILIIEEDDRPVGQLRLDLVARDVAEVSIGLAPEERGRGIGREALRLAVGAAAATYGATRLRALVRAENRSSLNAFLAAGFVVRREDDELVVLEMPSA
jgi:RimJ/RimL family protein N-acetyltransferase